MSTAAAIRTAMGRVPRGKPFTNARFLRYGSPGAVERALARLVAAGEISRVARGVFVRPRFSKYVDGSMAVNIREVAKTVTHRHGEVLQIHGFEAIRLLGFSTQMPSAPVYHTSGTTRILRVGRASVRLFHTSNRRLLQFAGTPVGTTISALWYLGKDQVTPKTVARIAEVLRQEDFEKLRTADMPAWMRVAFDAFDVGPTGTAHA